MKNFPVFALILLVVVPFLSCCKKRCQDPANMDCENYDPCFRKVSADFKMQIRLTNDLKPQAFEVDTVLAGRVVYFTAKDSTDVEYQWIFSNDPDTVKERSVALQFTFPTTLTVKLIVKRKNGCGLLDGGIDTISKKLVILEQDKSILQILGKYEGANSSTPNEKFIIELVYDIKLYRYYIQNLPKGCIRDKTSAFGSLLGFDYKYIDVGDWDIGAQKECTPIVGNGEFDRSQQKVTIAYRYIDYKTLQTINNIFIGKKL